MTTSAQPSAPRHTQLRIWYDQLTARIAAADKDIGRALSELDRQIHRERRAELTADRELVATYLDALEQDQPLPGLWPPEFKTADLLPASAFRGKSGRCDFYRHVLLPPNYIPRPELLAEVRAALLADSETLALTSAVKMDALHGMGGIGKSVLARALCDDPAVQTAFPDGILWATLGQTPDLIVRLREWIDALGGIVSETAPTADRLKAILADLLRERACLLIADDAWQKAHVEHFRVAGPAGRLLLTMRDAALAEELGGRVHPIPVMAQAEAVALLEEWAGGKVEAEVKAKIVKRLGCLPLAVKLAGAQLARKDPVEWLASFDARKLKARRVETLHDSLEATFALSLGDLAPTDRRLYASLAIFKEDEPTPVVAIGRLWSALDGRGAAEADELLDDLAARALLARSRQDRDAVTVHDLLRDFMATELGEEGRLAAHRGLLDAYRRTQRGAGWPTAPDDGYIFDHLAYHLDQLADHDAAAEAELAGLFADQTWLHARVPQPAYAYDGYLADLALAWRRGHAAVGRQIGADQEPSALADCVCYALIRTSVNSLAANYVPALVARAVETGLWSATRALSVLRRVPDPRRKAALAAALLGVAFLSPFERQQAVHEGLAAAQAIDYEGGRARALAVLAAQLTGVARDQALQAGLAAAQAITDEEVRVKALVALVPHLTGAACEQALGAGLAAAQGIIDGEARAEALAVLAPHLTGELLQAGLAAAQAIDYEEWRTWALAALAPQLAGAARELALQAGLAAAQTFHDPWSRVRVLVALAPHLTGEQLETWLAAALTIGDDGSRARVLAALVPRLTGETRQKALQAGLVAALTIYDEQNRASALAALAPHLTGEQLEVGLVAALTIHNEWNRASALAALAPRLVDELLQAGLTRALIVNDEEDRVRVLETLASHLMGKLLQAGLTAARAFHDEGYRAQALAALAPQLTGELLQAGLATAQAIDFEGWRVWALAALAPQLTGELLQAGLAAALAIYDQEDRVQVLAALAPQLTGAAREQALQAGLAAALAIRDEKDRARALAALAPQLTGAAREQALQAGLAAALAIRDEKDRARALAALSPQLTGAAREQALQAGLAAALAIRDEKDRARALAALAPQLTGAAREQALQAGLAAAQAIDDGRYRAWVLAALVPQLTDEVREQVLQTELVAVQASTDNWACASVLAALAPHLTGALLGTGLTAVQAIENEWSRAYALAAFLPVTPDPTLLLRAIRQAMADYLWNHLQHEKRDAVLQFCADRDLFTPPILSPTTLAAVAGHIIEICQEWEWL